MGRNYVLIKPGKSIFRCTNQIFCLFTRSITVAITGKTMKETDYECDTKEQTKVYNYEYRYMTKDMLFRNISTQKSV